MVTVLMNVSPTASAMWIAGVTPMIVVESAAFVRGLRISTTITNTNIDTASTDVLDLGKVFTPGPFSLL